ncbi:unnamed protein product [Brassica oleracea]
MVSEPHSSLLNREPDPPSSPESRVLAHWSYPILIGLAHFSMWMGKLVRLWWGEWNKEEDGTWNFHPDPMDFGFKAMIRDNETFESLVSIVRMRYVVGERTPIVLFYQFPSWTGNEQNRCINTHRRIT